MPGHRFRIAFLYFVLAALAGTVRPAAGQESLTVEEWREDLRVLEGLLIRLHADPYHTVSREALERHFRELDARLPELRPHEIIVGMQRVVASIGDGHTRLNASPGSPGVPAGERDGFARLPVRFYRYAEGLFVESAAPDLGRLVGSRVLEIGRLSADDAFERASAFAHHDNAMTLRLVTPFLLATPAVLHATGAIDSIGPVGLVLETPAGETVQVALAPSAGGERVGVVEALDLPAPRWMDDRDRRYWFEAIPESRAVYVQVNASRPDEEEPMARFVERLHRALRERPVERVVLDLRRNGGGDNALTRPLLTVLGSWEATCGECGLYAIVGRATFSAAMVFATELERYTDAIFVGEPTGARPNQYGEIETFTLPHSGLTASYSSGYFQTSDPWDDRPWIAPDLAAETAFADLLEGRDPALEAALSHDFRTPSPGQALVSVGSADGVEAALEAHDRLLEDPARRWRSTEADLTRLGVHYWIEGPVESALPVFRRAVALYPSSAEAHEDLAETYAALQEPGDAARHALESLRLAPANGDAIEVLLEVCPRPHELLSVYLTSRPGEGIDVERLEGACPMNGAR